MMRIAACQAALISSILGSRHTQPYFIHHDKKGQPMAPATDSNINKHIGEYRILSLIGHGAYGSVYQAEHLVFDDDIVAIKLLRGVITSEEEQQRFFQEARLHKKL